MGVGYDVKEEKSRLRRELRQRLANVTDSERREEGKKVCAALMALPEVKEASTIMAYWAMPNELPVEDFVEACVRAGKRVALPVVKGSDLELHEYQGRDRLVAVPPFNILEPCDSPVVSPLQVEVVIVPGVAFDRFGGRMGHGKGFYDRLFPCMVSARLVGVCLSCQVVERVPLEPHDRRMDRVVFAQ